ncbi:MAG: hypothetical protein ACRD4O_07810 [Bryobacteraceae bacterium]
MKRLIACAWRYVPGAHPGMESLLSHADGKQRREVRKHLARCGRCRNIAGLLDAAIESGRQGDHSGEDRAAALLQETCENLHARMEAWHSVGECPGGNPCFRGKQGRSRQILDALEFYFGEEIAHRVDRGAGENAPDQILSSTKPFFAAFLGRKAANALAREIAGAAT